MTKNANSKANTWVRVFAGFYKRIGSDGTTVLAEISHDDNGTWSYMVKPFGKAGLAWQVTGYRTLAEAKRMAEASYRSYMRRHTALNRGRSDMAANDTEGLPLPERASEDNPGGASANALRIAEAAISHGWRIEDWQFCADQVLLRKRGRGYLRLTFTSTGRIISASTARKCLTANTASVLGYLAQP